MSPDRSCPLEGFERLGLGSLSLPNASVTCLDSHLNSDLNPDSLLDPDLNSDDTQLGEIPICHLNSGRLSDSGNSANESRFWLLDPDTM